MYLSFTLNVDKASFGHKLSKSAIYSPRLQGIERAGTFKCVW
jgi:hypothetical protein